jgi:transcriptional regulator of acetoin/glycerol metabolism
MTEHDDDTMAGFFNLAATFAAGDLGEDIQTAALSDLPVLISGPPTASREVAFELDRQSAAACGIVDVIDCRQQGAVDAVGYLTRDQSSAEGQRARILLLQEVHLLAPGEQARLAAHLERMRLGPRPTIRILSSSSVWLFERVQHHAFSEDLFYRLNTIHVVIPRDRWADAPNASHNRSA